MAWQEFSVPSFRRQASPAEQLSYLREALVQNAPPEELARLARGLDPGLVETLRWSITTGRQARPQPDPVFVRTLRDQLVQAASVSGITPPAMQPRPALLPPLAAPPAPERGETGPAVRRPRWAWGLLAAALLLVLVSGVWAAYFRDLAPPMVLMAPGAPATATLLDTTLVGAPTGYTPLTLDRWSFQPGGTLTVSPVDGPQWVVAETGLLVVTVDDAPQSLTPGQSLVIPAGSALAVRNPELAAVTMLRGVANSGFTLEEYDRGDVSKVNVLNTAAHPSLPPGPSRVVFDQLTIPPGTTMQADAATGQDWFQIDRGLLGLTLIGDALPLGWTSGQERELAAGEVIPRINPGMHLTMHNVGEDSLVLLRLRVEQPVATATAAAVTTPARACPGGSAGQRLDDAWAAE